MLTNLTTGFKIREGGDVAKLWSEYYDWIDFSSGNKCAGCNEDEDDCGKLDDDGFCSDCTEIEE